eukprot:4726445-Alexandrium_andersonii.AAC.1
MILLAIAVAVVWALLLPLLLQKLASLLHYCLSWSWQCCCCYWQHDISDATIAVVLDRTWVLTPL